MSTCAMETARVGDRVAEAELAGPLLIVDEMALADWSSLVSSKATLVFRGGITQLLQIVARLIAAGMARNTPAAVVGADGAGCVPALRASLAELPVRVAGEPLSASALIVVGGLADSSEKLWPVLTAAEVPVPGPSIPVCRMLAY